MLEINQYKCYDKNVKIDEKKMPKIVELLSEVNTDIVFFRVEDLSEEKYYGLPVSFYNVQLGDFVKMCRTEFRNQDFLPLPIVAFVKTGIYRDQDVLTYLNNANTISYISEVIATKDGNYEMSTSFFDLVTKKWNKSLNEYIYKDFYYANKDKKILQKIAVHYNLYSKRGYRDLLIINHKYVNILCKIVWRVHVNFSKIWK